MDPTQEGTVHGWAEADEEDVGYVRELAAEHEVIVELETEDGFVDPGTLTLLLVGTSLAVGTVSALIDERRGGQVIDLRPNADPMARRDRSVVHGLVVVVAVDGTVKVEVKEPRGMFGQVLDLLRDVAVGLVGASQSQVVQALEQAVGGSADVKPGSSSTAPKPPPQRPSTGPQR